MQLNHSANKKPCRAKKAPRNRGALVCKISDRLVKRVLHGISRFVNCICSFIAGALFAATSEEACAHSEREEENSDFFDSHNLMGC